MNIKMVFFIFIGISNTTQSHHTGHNGLTRHTRTSKMEAIRSNFCNSQTCEKCKIEVRRYHGFNRIGRMCVMILQIKNCCEIPSGACNILIRDTRYN